MSSSEHTIVWATDGSPAATAAFEEAQRLFSDSRFVAVHYDQRMTGRAGSYPVLADEQDIRAAISARIDELRHGGLDIELVIPVGHDTAADAIAEVAREVNADSIVCGTRGLGAFSGVLLGSVAQRLLHVAPCAVLAVPDRVLAARAPQPQTAQA